MSKIILITGARKGIGKHLAEYYVQKGYQVIGCSRNHKNYKLKNYQHFYLDVSDESSVKEMFTNIRNNYSRLDILINNAGISSMNHILLTPMKTVEDIMRTNYIGTYLVSQEGAKLMQKNKWGRIINFGTVATHFNLEGESAYASSKAAVTTLTKISAKEFAPFGITVNMVGLPPVKTDLISSVPKEKIGSLINCQAIPRFCQFKDISNICDFLIKPESNFITGQVIYLGGV